MAEAGFELGFLRLRDCHLCTLSYAAPMKYVVLICPFKLQTADFGKENYSKIFDMEVVGIEPTICGLQTLYSNH